MDIIVDLDGTLCDISHRRKYVITSPKNWGAFNEGIPLDAVNTPVATFLNLLREDKKHRILLMSGRTIRYQPQTLEWLRKNIPWGNCVCPYEQYRDLSCHHTCDRDILLYMRSIEEETNYVDDRIVKKRLLQEAKIDGYNPTVAIDDRKKVCDMWVEEGIFVFDVGQGKGNF